MPSVLKGRDVSAGLSAMAMVERRHGTFKSKDSAQSEMSPERCDELDIALSLHNNSSFYCCYCLDQLGGDSNNSLKHPHRTEFPSRRAALELHWRRSRRT